MIAIALAGVGVLASVYTYVTYYEPRTSCTILNGPSGSVSWTERNASRYPLPTGGPSCFQFTSSGHALLSFVASPTPVDIGWVAGDLNADYPTCTQSLPGTHCHGGMVETTWVAVNSTSGEWSFTHSADAYDWYGTAFYFKYEVHTSPPPQEWVNFTVNYGS